MQYEKILNMRWKSHNVSCASQAELIMQRMVSACRRNGTSAVSICPIIFLKKSHVSFHYMAQLYVHLHPVNGILSNPQLKPDMHPVHCAIYYAGNTLSPFSIRQTVASSAQPLPFLPFLRVREREPASILAERVCVMHSDGGAVHRTSSLNGT